MWWGDLVTMAWWDDLWLNESFATFIGYKVVADLMPEWGMWRDFVATLARPFNLDALVSTHPISFEVKNAKQATERFDVITYWKGAGVVRMIEGFLGAEAFRTGVRAYLDRYRERNATADDFWRELGTASGRDVAAIANAWIKQPGHPLLSFSGARRGRCASASSASSPTPAPPATRALLADPRGDQVRHRRRRAREARPGRPRRDRPCRCRAPSGSTRTATAPASTASRSTMRRSRAWCPSLQSALTAPERLDAGRQPVGAGEGGHDRRRPVLLHARRLSQRDRPRRAGRRSPSALLARAPTSSTTRRARRSSVSSTDSSARIWRRSAGTRARATAPTTLAPRHRDRRARRAGRAPHDVVAEARAPAGCATSRTPTASTRTSPRCVVGIAARAGDAGALPALSRAQTRRRQRPRRGAALPLRPHRLRAPGADPAHARPDRQRRGAAAGPRPPVRAPARRAAGASHGVGVHPRSLERDHRDRLDPMLQQNIIRALAQLTPEPAASEVRAFLPPRGTRRDARDDQPDGRTACHRRRRLPAAHARRHGGAAAVCLSGADGRTEATPTWSGSTSRCPGSTQSATPSSRSPR